MKLIALILGLVLERIATELLHLRELRWFDRYYDYGLHYANRCRGWAVHAAIVVLVALPAIPVLLVSVALRGEDAYLQVTEISWDLPYLLFAVLVVFLCLGPRDLGNEVDEYCRALDAGDEPAARRVLVELAETEHSDPGDTEIVEEAVFIQATNRIFGVVFWFVVLGPVGAWLYRIGDLLHRRTAFESNRDPELEIRVRPAVEALYGVLKWIPARLAALGYALTGNFDEALDSWRGVGRDAEAPFRTANDELVARVGRASMTGTLDKPSNTSAAARGAMRLVTRTLFLWVTILALMTIFGWAV